MSYREKNYQKKKNPLKLLLESLSRGLAQAGLLAAFDVFFSTLLRVKRRAIPFFKTEKSRKFSNIFLNGLLLCIDPI